MTTVITYRKTKSGEWVAYGPASQMPQPGDGVMIAKKDGGSDYGYIGRLGRVFTVGGTEMVYGYLDQARPVTRYDASGQHGAPRGGSRAKCDNCGERPAVATARDLSGFTGAVCGQCKREEGGLSFA